MSEKAKQILKRIISYAGVFFFVLAAFMLWWQLRNYTLRDIFHALLMIPKGDLLAACITCLVSYLVLSLYDYLALKYVGGKVSWWKWMLAGILGFAISNNAGNALVSGGTIRYRLYTRWHISGGDIFKMLTFSGITFFLGFSAILIIGYFMVSSNILNQSTGANVSITSLFIISLSVVIAYFAITLLFRGKSLKIGKLRFHVPTTKMAFFQMVIGIADGLLAGLVLYFCLIPFVQIPFWTYIGIFVIAQAMGVFSQVPGGLGVFETIFLLILPSGMDKANIFAGILAYRVIYYVLPLIGAGGLFLIYENYLRAFTKRHRSGQEEKPPILPKNGQEEPKKIQEPKK